MTETTARHDLPLLMPSQAQKHITHNEAVMHLDTLVNLALAAPVTAAPPASPAEGDCHHVGPAAAGVWETLRGRTVAFLAGGWQALSIPTGATAFVVSAATSHVFDGVDWVLPNLRGARLGLGGVDDPGNILSVAGASTLLSADASGSHRLQINRQAVGGTASMVFSTAYQGRCEWGLTGTARLALRLSTDGVVWKTGLLADPATGNISIGSGTDFLRQLTVSGPAPRLRVAASGSGAPGFEIASAGAASPRLSVTFDTAAIRGDISLDGVSQLSIEPTQVRSNVVFRGGNVVSGQYLHSASRAFIAGAYDPGGISVLGNPLTSGNLDHIWMDDETNTWHFCADVSYKQPANSTVQAAAFATSSDHRLKQDIEAIDPQDAIARLLAIRPVRFRWSESGKPGEGFVAHELMETFPLAVFGARDGTSPKTGAPTYQTVDLIRLIPVLVAAVQRLASERGGNGGSL